MPVALVDMLATVYGVPRSSWKNRASKRDGAGLVSPFVSRHTVAVPATASHRQILRSNARRRRRLQTLVHAALDALDWTIQDLTVAVNKRLRKAVSRSSMQFWATGTRQVGAKGASHSHPVQAPLEVRFTAEQVTRAEAEKRGLPDSAILRADAWPNVEPEA